MAKQTSLGKKEINSINRYIALLEQKGIKVSKVILFGSYAKGMAKPDSDIDIAVISSQFGQDSINEMMFLRKVALEIDSHIEPLPFSPQDLEDRYSTLAQEIKRYGVLI
ncbi:MAG: nucleotidyltransferase domain-containing protein [Pseudomonadota bacterium]